MLVVNDSELTIREAQSVSEGDELPVSTNCTFNVVDQFDLIEVVCESLHIDTEGVYLKPSTSLNKHFDRVWSAMCDHDDQSIYHWV